MMKKSVAKRVISLALTVFMLLAIVPAFAIESDAIAYSGSSSYMSGRFYTALKAVVKTGNQRTDIVNVAKSQVGYQEGNYGQLSGTVRGSSNYTEYGRWYGMQDMWCAMFVSWCAKVAGVSTSVVPSHAYTPTGLSWFQSRGQAYSRSKVASGSYTPKGGDIIYFKSSRNSASTNHIGIVTGYSGSTVYTVEGNTSSATVSTNGGAVAAKSYSISNTYIVYICKPSYSGTTIATTAATAAASYKTGTYKITAASLNIRASASATSTLLGSISNGKTVVVTATSGKWGKISYNGINGYISLAYASYVGSATTTTTASTATYVPGIYKIGSSGLNLRGTASASGTYLTTIPSGTTISVTAISGKWGKTTYSGKTGWISLAYTSLVSKTTTAATTAATAAPSTYTVGSYTVNTTVTIRNAGSASGTAVGYIGAGKTVTVTAITNTDWGKVTYNGITGYFRLTNATKVASAVTKTVTTDLNLRATASSSGTYLATIPEGTVLTIMSTSGTWANVTYNGKTGWCSTNYLK